MQLESLLFAVFFGVMGLLVGLHFPLFSKPGIGRGTKLFECELQEELVFQFQPLST